MVSIRMMIFAKHRKKALVCVIVLMIVSCCTWYLHASIVVRVKTTDSAYLEVKMPREDALLIEYFLRRLVVSEPFAYTLSGYKPVSLTYYEHPFTCFLSVAPENILFSMGWRRWQKYQHYFDSPRVVLWSEEEEGYTTILLANRNLCEHIIKHHAKDFIEVLGKIPDTNELLKQSVFMEKLKSHSGLLGILLGFGRGNAWLYYTLNDNRCGVPQGRLPNIWNLKNKKFSWKKFLMPRALDITNMQLPGFVGNPDSDESIVLKTQYLAARKRIINYYQGKNFLEATLNLYLNGADVFEE